MKEAPLIEIKSLNVGYEGRTVLHNVNLNVRERDFLGIIGPNGGGKTTLVRCILGLLTPQSGQIIFHPRRPSRVKQGLSIGYLPQYTSKSFFPALQASKERLPVLQKKTAY